MSDDELSELDRVLNNVLPDESDNQEGNSQDGREQEIINQLQKAAEELGDSPTIREFRDLDTVVSPKTVRRVFGTWNKAKQEAGLKELQRGSTTTVDIDENYFKDIDSSSKSYWLGTLFACSSVRVQNGEYRSLNLGRAKSYEYFVREFRDAIGSEHAVSIVEKSKHPGDENLVMTSISNPTFLSDLFATGYSPPDEPPGNFPSLSSKYWPAFIRGYIESRRDFGVNGFRISTETLTQAKTLQEQLEEFGVKRVTISETDSGGPVIYISNNFDIKTIFEICWPDRIDTIPSWNPIPQQILNYLEDEYPYPENVSYLPE